MAHGWQRRPSWILLIVLLIASAAQARDQLDTWCETTTDGFRIISDLSETDLQELLGKFAPFAELVDEFLPGTAIRKPRPLQMVIFKNRGDFRRILRAKKFTGFMQPSLTTNTLVIGPGQRPQDLHTTALHEYSHYLLRNRLDVSLPLWFDEGIASLLSSMKFHAETVEVGDLPRSRMAELVQTERRSGGRQLVRASSSLNAVSLRQALEAEYILDWSGERLNQFYDWSWLTTHYLLLGESGGEERGEKDRADSLNQYLSSRGASLIEHLQTDYREFAKALQHHVRNRVAGKTLQLPAVVETSYTYRCLEAADRDYQLAMAALNRNPKGAAQLLEPHFAAQPQSVKLLVAMARIEARGDDRSRARLLSARALQLAPEDVDATITHANLLVGDCIVTHNDECRRNWREAVPLYRSAIRIDHERFDAVFGLGLSYLYSGRPGEAVNYLRVVYGKTPWSSQVNFYLGEGYRLIGDNRARIHLSNARNWANDEFWRRVAETALDQLDNPRIEDQ